MNDTDLQKAFEDVRMAYLETFAVLPTDDVDNMLSVRARLEALENVRTNLFSAINDGKLEAFHIEQTKPEKELFKWMKKR